METSDAQEVQDVKTQLECICADVSAWECQGVAVERLEELLQQQIQEQLGKLNVYLQEQEIDPAWEMASLYQALVIERLDAARKRSADWLTPRLGLLLQVSDLDKSRCTSLKRELQSAPDYLAKKDQEKVSEILKLISQHQIQLDEEARSEQIKIWLSQFLTLQNIAALSRTEIERWLKLLRTPPNDIKSDELLLLHPVEVQLTAHLDQISMDEIIERIERLPMQAQHKLALLLSQRLMGI